MNGTQPGQSAVAESASPSCNGGPGNRIAWLDTARGLAFLMVIYSHLELCNPAVMKLFSPVFLGVFFFVSGYLHKSGAPFLAVLEQRTRTLFLPFLFWGTLLLLARQVFSFRETVEPFRVSFMEMLFQYGSGSRFIWFIPALYAYSLCFHWIDRFCRTPARLLAVSAGLFAANWILVFHLSLPPLPYTMHQAGFGCAYMGMGKAFRQLERPGMSVPGRRAVSTILAAATYAALALALPPVLWTGSSRLAEAAVLVLLGLSVTVRISKMLPENAFLSFVGSNSLLYFCLHGKICALLEFAVHRMCPLAWTVNPWLGGLLGAGMVFATAALLILPVVLINRFAPFTTGKGFKIW